MKTAIEIYEAQTGDNCPSNQMGYYEWYQRYVEWLENTVLKLLAK